MIEKKRISLFREILAELQLQGHGGRRTSFLQWCSLVRLGWMSLAFSQKFSGQRALCRCRPLKEKAADVRTSAVLSKVKSSGDSDM